MSDPTAARLRSLFKDLRSLGIDRGREAWPVLTRADMLTHRAASARTAAEVAWNRGVAELVKAGDFTDAARAELAVYAAANATDRGGERIVDRAVRSAYAVLIREAENAAYGDVSMFAALVKVADSAVKTIGRAGVPAGVHDEAGLFRAGVSTETWDAVKAAADRFQSAHAAYSVLRDLGWLPQYRVSAWHRYGDAEAAHPVARARSLPVAEAFKLVYAIEAGARPGMYDAQTAGRNHAESSNVKGDKR